MAVAPPAALLEFLGEAPSEAALRRPGSSSSNAPPRVPLKSPAASAPRGKGEDSSPETPGRPPHNDGGFDDTIDALDRRAPQPEAEAMPAAPSRGDKARNSERSNQSSAAALPPRAPAAEVSMATSPAGSTSGYNS